MAAYVISEVEVRDAQYGGRYLVRGGYTGTVEGGPPAETLTIVEFPSMAQLREWYASPEYAQALDERWRPLDRRLIFVECAAPA